jgi:hypothetical protein
VYFRELDNPNLAIHYPDYRNTTVAASDKHSATVTIVSSTDLRSDHSRIRPDKLDSTAIQQGCDPCVGQTIGHEGRTTEIVRLTVAMRDGHDHRTGSRCGCGPHAAVLENQHRSGGHTDAVGRFQIDFRIRLANRDVLGSQCDLKAVE